MKFERRQRIWTSWQLLRFKAAKKRPIEPPTELDRIIGLIPFADKPFRVGGLLDGRRRDIPLQQVKTFDRLPEAESDPGLVIATAIGVWLTRRVPPMQADAPEIDRDIHRAIDDHVTDGYRKAFRGPIRPTAFTGPDPDLGRLAVEGPYALFLERDADGVLRWDFDALGDYRHHDGLCNLGIKVRFEERPDHSLEATVIESRELGTVTPADGAWPRAARLALCAATTHTSLTRHFNDVHLIAANHWDVVTRNELAPDHCLFRLVWPHIANSLYTNYGITPSQMLPNGEFADIFSLSGERDGLYRCFDDQYAAYDIRVMDPELDWSRRGLDDATFEHPTQDNLLDLFAVMHDHTRRYLYAYYDSDDRLRDDRAVMHWLDVLDATIPNGIRTSIGDPVTRDGLARLIASFIHEGSVVHDLVGTTLWDYQLWADQNPTRVYRDGSRVRVDVFQRMVNNNFGLQLRRAGLLEDYRHLAIDDRGRSSFAQYLADCHRLQATYDEAGDGTPWRMEPRILEMNMNG